MGLLSQPGTTRVGISRRPVGPMFGYVDLKWIETVLRDSLRLIVYPSKELFFCIFLWVNSLSHLLQLFGISSKILVWLLFSYVNSHMFFREPLSEKALTHWLHWWGHSPVWILIWIIRACFMRMLSDIGYIYKVFPQYEFSYCLQDHNCVRKPCHSGCIDMVSPQYGSSYVF